MKKPDELLTEVRNVAQARMEARAANRRSFIEKTPVPHFCIVVWVDLLGFSQQLSEADTPAKFKAAFDRIRKVQEEFAKETASVEPEKQSSVNQFSGKRVIALSDGLVISLDLEIDCPHAEISSLYERTGSFLEEIRLAQVRCAFNGMFVRGGVKLGYFWFEDDILISPALVGAYEMEDKIAKQPVIILEREFADQLRSMTATEGYSPDVDPMSDMFRDCEWMDEPIKQKYVMLDFMSQMVQGDHGWHSDADRLASRDRSRPPEERQRILNESHHRQTGEILRSYKQTLIGAFQVAPPKAKDKYRWLIQYHNESFPHDHPALQGAAIDEINFLGCWLRQKWCQIKTRFPLVSKLRDWICHHRVEAALR